MSIAVSTSFRLEDIPSEHNTEARVLQLMEERSVRAMVSRLPALEREVEIRYWGLVGGPESFADIAGRLNVSTAAIARTHRRALATLRRQAGSNRGDL